MSAPTSDRDLLSADLAAGLWASPPSLPPRWFYDERGSRLFDEITRRPEYYPTSAEREILQKQSDDVRRVTGATTLVELGAGMSTKTRVLLDAFTLGDEPVRFSPLDISAEVLHESAEALRAEYPGLHVEPAVADFHDHLGHLAGEPGERLMLFLGGTIGNFGEDERAGFLQRIRAALDPGDHFLLGADLVKDPDRLEAAYDDAAGVTADFNLNLLDVITRTVDAQGLDREDFAHRSHWNARDSRVEMWLDACRPVRAWFPTLERRWELDTGQGLLTEISRKFEPELLHAELAATGLEPVDWWTDSAGDYSLTLCRASDGAAPH